MTLFQILSRTQTQKQPRGKPFPRNFPVLLLQQKKTRLAGQASMKDWIAMSGRELWLSRIPPFPKVNSAGSVEKYGSHNPARPYKIVAKYLENLFTPYLHLVTFNTTVERLEKVDEEWVVTLRQSGTKR